MHAVYLYGATVLVVVAMALAGFLAYRHWFAKTRLYFATGWNVIHKRVSTWLAISGFGIAAFSTAIADGLKEQLGNLPPDLLSPATITGIGTAIFALKFFAMIWQQRGLLVQAKPAAPVVGPRLDGGSQ